MPTAPQIEVNHRRNGRLRHKILSFTPQGARNATFPVDSEEAAAAGRAPKTKSVEAYFVEKYQLRLKYPLLPCVVVGSKHNGEWIPVECCNIITAPGEAAHAGREGSECDKRLWG